MKDYIKKGIEIKNFAQGGASLKRFIYSQKYIEGIIPDNILPRTANSNVDRFEDVDYMDCFQFEEKIDSVVWMDNGVDVPFIQENIRKLMDMAVIW